MSKFTPKLITVKKPRSNFNLSRVNRFSASPMLAIPVAWEEVLPDDTFIVDYENRITTDSLLSPTLGAFKVSIHEFFCPLRLYSYSLDRNVVNRASATWDNNLALPRRVWPAGPILPSWQEPASSSDADVEAAQLENSFRASTYNSEVQQYMVARSSLADFLGVPAGWVNLTVNDIDMSGTPWLAYYDIIRNYFVHQQSGYFRICNTLQSAGQFGVMDYPLANLDYYVGDARNSDGYVVNDTSQFLFSDYRNVFEGLCCTTFMPDQFQNYLSNSVIENLRSQARIDVQTENGESFVTVDDLRFANKLQRYLELSVLGGNSKYSDWLHAHWGVTVNQGIVKPEYLGTTTSWVKFGEVISTSNTQAPDDNTSITGLGTRGGIGFGRGKGRKRRYNFKENGVYMAIMTIVPEIDYSQGIRKSLLKPYFSDLFVPSLDGIGFQDIAYSEINALPQISSASGPSSWFEAGTTLYMPQEDPYLSVRNSNPFATSVGKQPAWMEYMTAQNELHGRLAYGGDLSYWAVQRNFFKETSNVNNNLLDYRSYSWSPYGTPFDFNYLFNNIDEYAQNFICEVKVDLVAKRQISKNIRPTL